MNIFSYRRHLRFLSSGQRRRWWDQRMSLQPRVAIGRSYVPRTIASQFTYVKVS
ncbi:hypothetical protein [Chitinasiproducens palmae]|uniref:Uncharacterized protein n=1 Tax=Chitinasiproducens palmae TaxID=1770053 RepID=A0A1H2PNF7_9BURK|nr:hypothetical protein [Chitinasiproducens palmae]SDV47703.1 hypothetical protein SAMN05216551_103229 [Chitinasiproducens palmae]